MLHINGANFFSAESPLNTWGFNQVEDLQEKDRPYLSRFFVIMLIGQSAHEGVRNIACLVIKPPVDSFAFTVGQIPPVKTRVWTQLEDIHLVEETALKTLMVLALHVYKAVMFLIFSPLCCLCVGFISPSLNKKIHEALKLIDTEKVDDDNQEEELMDADALDLEDRAPTSAVPPTPPPRTFSSSRAAAQDVPPPPPPPPIPTRARKGEESVNQQEPPEAPPRSAKKSVRVVSPHSTASGSAEAPIDHAPPKPPPPPPLPRSNVAMPPPPPPRTAVAPAPKSAPKEDLATQLRRKLEEKQKQAGGEQPAASTEETAAPIPTLKRENSLGLHPKNPALQKFMNIEKDEKKRRSTDFNRASSEWRDDAAGELKSRLAAMKRSDEAKSSAKGSSEASGETAKQTPSPAERTAAVPSAQPKLANRKLPPTPDAKPSPGVKFASKEEVISSPLPSSATESQETPQGKSILKRQARSSREIAPSDVAAQETVVAPKKTAEPVAQVEGEDLDKQEQAILLQIKLFERSKRTQGTMGPAQLRKAAARFKELNDKLEDIQRKKEARDGRSASTEVAPVDPSESSVLKEEGVAEEVE